MVLSTTILSGCSSVEKLEFFSKPIEKTALNLKTPAGVKLDDINWKVITETNADEVFKKLKDKDIDPVLIGLTDDDYEKLSVISAILLLLVHIWALLHICQLIKKNKRIN